MGGTTTVQLTSTGPQPASVTVGVGDVVSFVNADAQNHSVVSTVLGFISPVIYPGQTYSHTMDTPGKFSYTQTNFGPPKKGMIVVTVNGSVQLTANRPSVVYGGSVVLSGKSPLPGRPVTVSTQPAGHHHGKAWTDLATLPTSADGSFSTVVRPTMNSSYRVTVVAKLLSQPVTVGVKPRLTIAAAPLKLSVGHAVRVVARIIPATAATSLELRQLTGTKRARTLAQKTVPASGTVVFSWKVTQGRSLLRVEMPKVKGGSTFQATFSRSIAVTGIGSSTASSSSKSSTKPHGKRHGKH
jgi:hypothetical protein